MQKKGRSRYGDGSVFLSASGKWCAALSVGSGKNRAKIRRFADSEASAIEALKRLRSESSHLLTVKHEEIISFERTIDKWLSTQKARVRNSSFEKYKRELDRGVSKCWPALVKMRVDRIRPEHITELFVRLESQGASPAARAYVHLLIKSVFASVEGTAIAKSPVLKSHRPKVPSVAMKVWTADEAQRFLEATSNTHLGVLYRIALSCGLRMGELRALQWSDVDLESGRIIVQRSMSLDGILGELKTRSSRRTIELPPGSLNALRRQRRATSGPWVFPLPTRRVSTIASLRSKRATSEPYRYAVLGKHFRRDVAAAGVPAIRFHDLRHTCATLQIAAGVPAKVVSEMLGHSHIGITLELYAHVIPSMRRSAADLIDAILPGETY